MSRLGSWDRKIWEDLSGLIDHVTGAVNTTESLSDLSYAERVIESTYGDVVSIKAKGKQLNKFGLSNSVGTALQTIARFPSINETYVSTNIITRIVSTNVSDTQTLVLEGDTIDGFGNLTFSIQNVTLNGQTVVTLTTPLARANRLYVKPSGTFNAPQTNPLGAVSVYDNLSGVAAGVPSVPTSVKLTIQAGEANSQKCATSISSSDYYIVTQIQGGIGAAGGNASRVIIRAESRDIKNGGVWRPLGRELTVPISGVGVQFDPHPFLIIPKNHDIRLRARTDSNTAFVFGEINGYLAGIVT
jgi:hypothetical protein